jgi:N-acetyl-gamma-glutamyl-phosphate reductase
MKDVRHRVFIDGRAGTVGLRIEGYLSGREDIELVGIGEDVRTDMDARLDRIRSADVTFLCLGDEASREIVAAVPADARVIDASTAHRTADGWVYGLPELAPGQRGRIAKSGRVAVAGCHAAGFILLARPLVDAGLVDRGYPFSIHSVTGYSGGGKGMIAAYEARADARDPLLEAPRQYALGQTHKHIPEMVKMSGVDAPPHFSPHVANFYAGLEMTVPLHRRFLTDGAGAVDVRRALEDRYRGERFVKVAKEGADPEGGFLSAGAMAGGNDMEIFVLGNEERILLVARYDNLGKGASGSAVQCMNLMLGLPEESGLV